MSSSALVNAAMQALPFNIAFAERHQNSDPPYPLMLRPRSNRPRRRAAEQRDELAPPHVGPPPPESVYRTFSLPQGGGQVF